MIIDLSLPIRNNTPEPDPPRIRYLDHAEGARSLAEGANLIAKKLGLGEISITENDFPGGMGLANEEVQLDTHAGTHLDAPWHFGPMAGARRAITIDEVPLEWCYSDGVALDLSHKPAGSMISRTDIAEAVEKTGYVIKEFDIVLIRTGADSHFEKTDYFSAYPGMSSEATDFLLDAGVKIIGIDAWGFDRPAAVMLREYLETGNPEDMFPAHFTGRKREYLHLEKLANLDKLPEPFGFKVACFPVKVEKASAGWCRVVAIL